MKDPGQFEVIVVIMNGCLKLSNAGKWRLGFTKMTNYAGASRVIVDIRILMNPRSPSCVVVDL